MIFDIKDKTGRKIYLTEERWSHIKKRHPEIEYFEGLKEAITSPDKLVKIDEVL